jgi:wyosine [tRNA(Phe)-imidazoG37] synthetase (radical SAM superfamily)
MVNRPASGLTLEEVVDGLAAFRREYQGKIWLEVMVLAGITELPERIRPIARLASRIAPDRVQLNTPVRPTFDERAAPLAAERLAALSRLFTPQAEVIAEWGGRHRCAPAPRAADSDGIIALLKRRPCTVDDITGGLDLHPNAVLKALSALEWDGEVHRVLRDGHVFWHAIPRGSAKGRKGAR